MHFKNKKKTMLRSRHSYLTNKEKLFVCIYDSLREKLNIHSKILDSSKKIGEFQSLPEFALVKGNNEKEPLLLNNYNQSVIFDVYEITEKDLEQLNKHYGYICINSEHNINNREKIITPFGEAYVFINNQKLNSVKIIESGDWVDYSNYHTIIESPEVKLIK